MSLLLVYDGCNVQDWLFSALIRDVITLSRLRLRLRSHFTFVPRH